MSLSSHQSKEVAEGTKWSHHKEHAFVAVLAPCERLRWGWSVLSGQLQGKATAWARKT